MTDANKPSGAALDFPAEQPKAPPQDSVKTIPITERGSTVRVPAPVPEPVKDVERTPEETVKAALEAPGHQVGDVIEGPVEAEDVGLFACRVDALGRVWRYENGMRVVLAGRLQT